MRLSLRGRDSVSVAAVAALFTGIIGASVLNAPTSRVFGMDTVGRHHDPFTVMRQFEQPVAMNVYTQPLTDWAGVAIARVTGGVAAYNWLVLVTFPLAAVAAFLLARHLRLTTPTAALAGLAFAFSPFHLAHAAYHPHIAQVQWVPFYFLALWRALDKASAARLAALGLAAACVTLSNFYGGMIAAVMTPFAAGAYWWTYRRTHADAGRHLALAVGTLIVAALAGVLWIWWHAPSVLSHPSAYAAAPSDPFRYSAKWWSYLVPPLAQPWIGASVRSFWTSVGVGDGLLEQQVSIGVGVSILGGIALAGWWRQHRSSSAPPIAPMLAGLAAVALIWSLSPERTIAGVRVVRPSALLVQFLPMFRAYARFGVVVQLMAVLLAGLGAEALWRTRRSGARLACVTLILLAMTEYAVSPAAMSRDVLPTSAHRWLMAQPANTRALDCTPLTMESESVQWLTNDRVTMSGGTLSDCLEPRFADKLAARGYTHLLVRRDSPEGQYFADHSIAEGLRLADREPDGMVFEVTAPAPSLYVDQLNGFSERETGDAGTWRWMAGDASLDMVNSAGRTISTTLTLELASFGVVRHLQLRLDGVDAGTIVVTAARQSYTTPRFDVPPGRHTLALHPTEPPIMADAAVHNGDRRLLSFALSGWTWTPEGRP